MPAIQRNKASDEAAAHQQRNIVTIIKHIIQLILNAPSEIQPISSGPRAQYRQLKIK
jgi:hypothetical protein